MEISLSDFRFIVDSVAVIHYEGLKKDLVRGINTILIPMAD
jgi:hypothetical protein